MLLADHELNVLFVIFAKMHKISIKENKGDWRGQTTIALNKHQGDGLRFRNKLGFDLLSGIDEDPNEALDRIESRLDKITSLKRKYGVDADELVAKLNDYLKDK